MQELPRGTVTFVFTDIEGSTELLKKLGDAYGDVLAAHRGIVREVFTGADGIEIDTQGDAFFFAFPRARDAVAAAVEVQRAHAGTRWPPDAAVRVRIGLHTGEPVVGEEGYHGLDVVRAARICTAGRGGVVLLSETTRALLGSGLPEGVSVFPLGERRLKGLDEPERVYELAIEDVEIAPEFPPAPATEAEARPGGREGAFERRAEELAAGLAERIQARVLRKIEASFDKKGIDLQPAGTEDEDVDDIAARAASLNERIAARIDAAFKEKGIPPDDE